MRNGGTAMRPRKTLFILSAVLVVLSAAGAGAILGSPQQNSAPTAQTGSDALPMPATDIIRKFAANESQFKLDRDNYTYSQSVLVEASTTDGRDGGRFQQDSDIIFTPEGKRYEKVTFAPQNTLQAIQLTPQDMKDLESVQP